MRAAVTAARRHERRRAVRQRHGGGALERRPGRAQTEHKRRCKAAGVCAHVQAAGVGARREQAGIGCPSPSSTRASSSMRSPPNVKVIAGTVSITVNGGRSIATASTGRGSGGLRRIDD